MAGDDARRRELIDARLAALVPEQAGAAGRLTAAARYALLAEGKRLRPLLAMAAAEQWGGDPQAALDPGCAIEMVHAASLILDDLPSMDDAQLRRGAPTVHRVFGEGLAVLAAVALLSRAFGVLGEAAAIGPAARLRLVSRLGAAVGFDGLTVGQTLDLYERGDGANEALLTQLNHQKTGVLFELAAEAGALAAGAADGEGERARRFGEHLGAAFQLRDDLLDLEGDAAVLGKDVGQDGDKPTVARLLGPAGARSRLQAELNAALDAVGRTGPLAGVALAAVGAAAPRTPAGGGEPLY
jgi:geranylgeranyl diphosphate synthase type II